MVWKKYNFCKIIHNFFDPFLMLPTDPDCKWNDARCSDNDHAHALCQLIDG